MASVRTPLAAGDRPSWGTPRDQRWGGLRGGGGHLDGVGTVQVQGRWILTLPWIALGWEPGLALEP